MWGSDYVAESNVVDRQVPTCGRACKTIGGGPASLPPSGARLSFRHHLHRIRWLKAGYAEAPSCSRGVLSGRLRVTEFILSLAFSSGRCCASLGPEWPFRLAWLCVTRRGAATYYGAYSSSMFQPAVPRGDPAIRRPTGPVLDDRRIDPVLGVLAIRTLRSTACGVRDQGHSVTCNENAPCHWRSTLRRHPRAADARGRQGRPSTRQTEAVATGYR